MVWNTLTERRDPSRAYGSSSTPPTIGTPLIVITTSRAMSSRTTMSIRTAGSTSADVGGSGRIGWEGIDTAVKT